MEIHRNVYIGYVDILGYSSLEGRLTAWGTEVSEVLITNMFTSLERIMDLALGNTNINYLRYGDGFVYYSQDEDIENLSDLVVKNCLLLSLSLNESIPLRVSLTQNTLNVDDAPNGLTVSGRGWEELLGIERSLSWMGGLLYLPAYDGTHHNMVERLIQTTFLVTRQVNAPEVQFVPPFIEAPGFNTERTWFLNWQKCLNQPKRQVDRSIQNWWGGVVPCLSINDSADVRVKQNNSIRFADYCRQLRQASNLVYFSGVDRNVDIGAINGQC